MKIQTIIGVAVLYVLFVIYQNAGAEKKSDIFVKVKPPATPEGVVEVAFPFSNADNQDGTSTLGVFLCGTEVWITYPNEKADGPEMEALANELIKKHCGMFL